MGNTYSERGVTLQHAPEDEMADRDGRFEGIADDIVEVMVSQPLALGKAEWVQEKQDSQVLGCGKERAIGVIGKIDPADVGRHLDAAQVEIVDAAAHLGNGKFGRLQGHRTHADQTVGVPRNCIRNAVIDRDAQVAAKPASAK
jgi:hypothetical protein